MRTSATIILVRNTPELEVYWVKRGGDAPFLSGFRVFPGGHIEDNDYLDSSDSIEIAARRAALRELREEVGLDLVDRMEQLNFLGTWTTPPYLVFPLTAHFFALEIEPSMTWVSESDCEVEEGEWISPGDALLRWASGRVLLAPPTLSILRCLENSGLDSLPSAFTTDEASGREPTYSQIHPDKMMIPTRTPTLPPATHTNCYVLGQSDLLVIEPASSESKALDAVIDYLDRKVEEGARIRAVVLTHHHHDHIGGVETVCDRYQVPVWAHSETAVRVPFSVHRELEHNDEIELSDGTVWRVIFTPGHAPGHICLFEPSTRAMVVGDMVAGVGSILVEPTEGDMGDYLESLQRMKAENPSLLMPSHGPVIGGAINKISEYIYHRLERERACLLALQEHEHIQDLVNHVYKDVPKQLRSGPQGGLAGLSLRAHLNKLVKDGTIRPMGSDRWARVS